MKNTVFLILLTAFCTFYAAAQDSNLGVSQANNRFTSRSSLVYDENNAYLSKDWNVGRVFFFDGKTEDLPINFNAYNRVLEQLQNDKKLTFDKPVKSFILGDTSVLKGHLFLRGFHDIDQQDKLTFYELLHQTPNFKLLKFPEFKTLEKRGFNEANIGVTFTLFESYYVAFTTGQLQKVRVNKKQILDLFPSQKEQLTSFIEKENLKFKDWNDVAQVLSYVETLF